MDETLKVALQAAAALDALGMRWFLGGSLASSLHGVPRATLDADLIAELKVEHVKPLILELGDAWYLDEAAIREAVTNRASFNLIHLDTAMKVDVFVSKGRAFDERQFARARRTPVESGSKVEIPVCSVEDIVIAKLDWFRLGHEISERQWADILGVLRVNRTALDHAVLAQGAHELGVDDLLTKALAEAGINA